MNPTLIAAICGFLFRELLAIEGREDRTVPFDLWYYVRKNWIALALNTVGTSALYLAIPELMHMQREQVGQDYPVLTGFVIGLLGAWLVRWIQSTVKGWLVRRKEQE